MIPDQWFSLQPGDPSRGSGPMSPAAIAVTITALVIAACAGVVYGAYQMAAIAVSSQPTVISVLP